jgi:opacity protein-like surface antigen
MGAFKKTLTGFVCLAAMVAPAMAADYTAPSQGAWYLRGEAGVGITDFSILDGETAFAMGVGIGYKYNEMLRTDITFDAAFDYSDSVTLGAVGAAPLVATASVDAYDIMLNGYFDLPMFGAFKPYIGAGIGYGWVDGSVSAGGGTIAGDDDGLALGGMAGITFDLSEQMAIDVGYKYRVIMISGEDFDDHLIRGGLRFYFN